MTLDPFVPCGRMFRGIEDDHPIDAMCTKHSLCGYCREIDGLRHVATLARQVVQGNDGHSVVKALKVELIEALVEVGR